MDIILASTSRYRRSLLQRLGLNARCVAPLVEEIARPQEAPAGLALRLAQNKAAAVARRYPSALVIGSDQVASVADTIMGKPGSHAAARAQLKASSGRAVQFHTAIAVTNSARATEFVHVDVSTVYFRPLNDNQIDYYLRAEQPYDCAGSFKCEGLGIALFERWQTTDPSALEGLPLIALTRLLAQLDVDVLGKYNYF